MNIKRLIAKFMVPKGERCNKVNKKLLNYTDSSLPMKLRKIMARNMLKQNKDKTIGEWDV